MASIRLDPRTAVFKEEVSQNENQLQQETLRRTQVPNMATVVIAAIALLAILKR